MSDLAIKIQGLSKEYNIGSKKSDSLRDTLSGLLVPSKRSANSFWALKDVSFNINAGEAVGIIGRNGAGKSTLLKILSKITHPTSGRIELDGRVASLLEVGTGFHPELTGRENIFLNGTILGMSRAEINKKFDAIVDFSGVEKFLDTPVKHYSSGMYVRLAFSVAAYLEPEILVVDEVLAVGDAEFQRKCLGKMSEVADKGRTVLFVSHNMGAIKTLCNSAVLLDSGQVVTQGRPDDVISAYLQKTKSQLAYSIDTQSKAHLDASITGVSLRTVEGVELNEFSMDDPFQVIVEIESKKICDLTLSAQVKELNHNPIFHFSCGDESFKITGEKGTQFIEVTIPPLNLYPGQYILRLALVNTMQNNHDEVDNISFKVNQNTSIVSRPLVRSAGMVFLNAGWRKIESK